MAKKIADPKTPVRQEGEVARPRGRPCDPEVRLRILESAREHFFERGLDGASMERIAESANTSKVTLYKYFPSKETLFNAVANECRIQRFNLNIEGLELRSPAEALEKIAEEYWAMLTDLNTMVYIRFLAGNAINDVAPAASFIAGGPDRVRQSVARLLRRLNDKGAVSIDDPDQAAEMLLAMLKGSEHIRMMFGLTPREESEQKAYMRACVGVFLRAYAKT